MVQMSALARDPVRLPAADRGMNPPPAGSGGTDTRRARARGILPSPARCPTVRSATMRTTGAVLLSLLLAFQALGMASQCAPCAEASIAPRCCSAGDAGDAHGSLDAACCCAWQAPVEPPDQQGLAEPVQLPDTPASSLSSAGAARAARTRPALASGLSGPAAVPILQPPLFLLKHSYLI